jgi:phytoene dehydrogenase-like protein
MNNPRFDGIVIGAGHNGLITAAYLARAGLKVAVFERRPDVGGAFATEELTVSGFKHNIHALYVKIHDSPVHSDLDLGRYGVSYVFPPVKQAFVRHNSYFVYREDVEANYQSLKRISNKDAETYRKVVTQWRKWYLDFIQPDMYSAPKPPDQWEAETRKKPGGNEYADVVLNYSPLEYARELYETDYAQYMVIRGAQSAEYEVTAKGMPTLVLATIVNWFAGRTALVRGGTRQISVALARVIEEHGGKIFTGEPAEQIIVEGGAAKGIVLKDGRQVYADRFVASSIDPIHTFLFMVGEDKLPEEIKVRLGTYRFSESSLFRVHLALRERPIFEISKQDPAINDAFIYSIGYEKPDNYARYLEQSRGGQVPDIVGLSSSTPSVHDPSQAPAGMHAAYIGINAPFNLAGGGGARWVEAAQEVGERMLEMFKEYAPNMTKDNILGKFSYTPKDIEEYLPDLVSGDICQGKICPEQLGYNRPWPGMSQYRTFIENLYLCGAASHPGGHATGGPGYNAANAIAENLGIAKWWPPYDPRKIVRFP